MKEPNGENLLATLVRLYAEQEGLKIEIEMEGRKENEKEVA